MIISGYTNFATGFLRKKLTNFSSIFVKTNNDENYWKPDILIFSNADINREGLLTLASAINLNKGKSANFDLSVCEDNESLFSNKLDNSVFEKNNIFVRRQNCNNFFDAVDTISKTFAYPNFEPDTVLISSKSADFNNSDYFNFSQKIYNSELNFLIFDKKDITKAGTYSKIDLWYKASYFGGFASFYIAKYLSEFWKGKKNIVRVFVYNDILKSENEIRESIAEAIENIGINVEINFFTEKEISYVDSIKLNSSETDLTIVNFPSEQSDLDAFFEINKFLKDTLLIKVSQKFVNYNYQNKKKFILHSQSQKIKSVLNYSATNDLTANEPAKKYLDELILNVTEIDKTFENNYINPFFEPESKDLETLVTETDNFISKISNNFNSESAQNKKDTLNNFAKLIQSKTNSYIKNYQILTKKKNEIFNSGILFYRNEINKISGSLKEFEFVAKSFYELKDTKKAFSELKKYNEEIYYKVKLKEFLTTYFPASFQNNFSQSLLFVLNNEFKNQISAQKSLENIFGLISDALVKLESGEIENEYFSQFIEKLNIEKEKIQKLNKPNNEVKYLNLSELNSQIFEEIKSEFLEIDLKKLLFRLKNRKNDLKNQFGNQKKYSDILLNNRNLHSKSWEIDSKFNEFKNQISIKNENIKDVFSESVSNNILKIISDSKAYLTALKSSSINKKFFEFEVSEFMKFAEKDILLKDILLNTNSHFNDINTLLLSFPEKEKLFSQYSYQEFYALKIEISNTRNVKVKETVNYYLENEYYLPLKNMFSASLDKISELEEKYKNIFRLIKFSFFDNNGKLLKTDDESVKEFTLFLESAVNNISEIENEIFIGLQNIEKEIDERLFAVKSKLNSYQFSSISGEILKVKSKIKNSKPYKFTIKIYNNIKSFFQNQVNKFWFRKSELLLIKNELSEKKSSKHNFTDELIDFTEIYSPKKEVLETIPFYYKDLFLRDDIFNNEFFIGRETELSKFEKALKRYYKEGNHGAISITGQQYSGKSFFAHFALDKFMSASQKYSVNAPFEGSSDIEIFKKTLNKTFSISGSVDKIFTSLSAGNIIVFENMELWFTKSPEGFEVIKEIFRIADNYSNKFLFIFIIKTETYNFFNLIENISDKLISNIEIKPLNAEQIKDAIVLRHNYSGFNLKSFKKSKSNINKRKMSKLFSDYFDSYNGNIGISMYQWISNIRSFSENTVFTSNPAKTDFFGVENIEPEYKEILKQFVLHGRISPKKLSEILFQNETVAKEKLRYLKRAGLITELQNENYCLNKYIYDKIVDKI